jgi:SAM-dependent methyltransferase
VDPEAYNAIAEGPFAPLYPYYAGQIVAKTGIRTGIGLDAGCGGGHLGFALAAITSLQLHLLDQSPEMLQLAQKNIAARELGRRMQTLLGTVEAIPLPAESVDLVVSRGSLPFWEDLPRAFGEIYRVLKPGGHACVGGGLGTPEMRQKIQAQMREWNRDPSGREGAGFPRQRDVNLYLEALATAGIRDCAVARRDDGTWVEIRKNGRER